MGRRSLWWLVGRVSWSTQVWDRLASAVREKQGQRPSWGPDCVWLEEGEVKWSGGGGPTVLAGGVCTCYDQGEFERWTQ